MEWWGWLIITVCISCSVIAYACCKVAGKADEQMGLK